MKKSLLTVVFALLCSATFAQSQSGFGIKGGLNYNSNGDYFESAEAIAQDPDGNAGFHLGVYYRFGKKIYVRPELMFTKTRSEYPEGQFDLNKLDLPVLVGIKVVGPLYLFAGPDFQYILNTKYEDITIDDIESDFTVGVHIGAGVNLGPVGVDLRYERGLSANEATFINDNVIGLPESRIDTRSSQLILSLSVKI